MAVASLKINLGVAIDGLTAGLRSASNSVDQFYARIGSRASAAVSPVTAVAARFRSVGAEVAGLGRSAVAPLGGLATGVGAVGAAATTAVAGVAALAAGAVALGAAAGGVVAVLAKGGLERIGAVSKEAAQIGITTDALSALQYAAKQTGAEADDVNAALRTMTIALGEAATESNPAAEALDKMGLSAKELAGQTPDAAFARIADGLKKVEGAASRAAIANGIFGEDGLKVAGLLAQGSDGLARYSAEAQRLGVSVSQVDAARVQAAQAAIGRAGAAVEGLGNQLATRLAPFVEAAASTFADLFAKIGDGGKNVDMVLDSLASGVAKVADFAGTMASTFLRGLAAIASGASKVAGILGFDSGFLDGATSALESMASKIDSVKPGEKLLGFYSDLKVKAGEAAAKVAESTRANLAATGSAAGLGKAVGDAVSKLREQVGTFGLSGAAAEVYKLQQAGATEAELAEAKALAKQLDGLEAAKKAREDLQEFGKSQKEALATPVEKALEQVTKLQKAFDGGLIDQATLDRGVKAAGKDAGLNEAPKFAGAVDANSKEGYRAILAATTGRGKDGVEQNTKTIAEHLATLIGLGRDQVRLAKGQGGAAPVMAI